LAAEQLMDLGRACSSSFWDLCFEGFPFFIPISGDCKQMQAQAGKCPMFL
jgi:hypothetical protein